MNNPKSQLNRSLTRGARFALVALLSGIAVTSMISRAHDKHRGEKRHGAPLRPGRCHARPPGCRLAGGSES